ncbi:MAG: hypothetical protein JW795_02610, partial [Chitinivibrionales bacterium]|nr:hypothetical protein [Chitinivibrionales bacterium]
MRLFFSLLVCCAALICSIGCGSDTTSSQNGNSIESLPVRRVVDTIIHTDSIVSKRLLFSKSDSVHEKYSRYIISGKRYTNTYDDSTRVIRYESIDTLVIASFIITMVNPTTLIVKKDTIVQIDTLSGVTKMNSTEKIYRDTVDDVLAVVDTQFTMFVIATTSDFLTGNMAIAGAGGNFPAKSSLLPIHSDSRVQTYGGSVYIIERFTKDNIIRINGSTISPATIAYQHHLGDGVNLHDIAFISETKAYVTQYNSADLLVFNPATGTV